MRLEGTARQIRPRNEQPVVRISPPAAMAGLEYRLDGPRVVAFAAGSVALCWPTGPRFSQLSAGVLPRRIAGRILA